MMQIKLPKKNKNHEKICMISDDPYYCGLRARIPNFAKSKAQKEKESSSRPVTQNPLGPAAAAAAAVMPPPHAQHPMAAWHHGAPQRGYPDNGISRVEFYLYSTTEITTSPSIISTTLLSACSDHQTCTIIIPAHICQFFFVF